MKTTQETLQKIFDWGWKITRKGIGQKEFCHSVDFDYDRFQRVRRAESDLRNLSQEDFDMIEKALGDE